ncbi:MAG TPA: rhodanese-like domain-containing protein, partial [Pseudorhodoferax sp.]|nr:rhodanese-like domain-containing protein [Pseudorhodoferax sp.]
MQSTVTATELHARLSGSQEIALLDVREASDFVRAHLNLARHLPLSQLELLAAKVLPRRGTPIVVCDDNGGGGGFAERAAAVLARLGYADVALLAGGVAAWQAQGLPTSAGYGTLVRAFADQARLHFGIDTITPTQLRARLASGRSTTVIDVRPAPEFHHASIPGACNHPGMELARMDFSAPDPDHLWVINCFSRTRGVIGTSTLKILGDLQNVAFLEDGVMSWFVHGFDTAQGATPAPPLAEQDPDALRAQAARIIDAHGLSVITPAQLDAFRRDEARTLYVFDVRLPAGQAGPVGRDSSDIQCVPGGQLLMHYDTHVGTRHARIVLVDDDALLRSAVCAFWLSQLGDGEVHILRGQPAPCPAAAQAPAEDDGRGMTVEELRAHLDAGQATVVDVAPSVEFE